MCRWTLGNGLDLAVKLWLMVQKQRPALVRRCHHKRHINRGLLGGTGFLDS
jgi:hypothetical protein